MNIAVALLSVEGLTKSYGGIHAVRGVSFSLQAGEILALIGPNGAGKSTCFDMLNGQNRPDSGRISVAGQETTGKKPREVWRLGVGRTFQITATFPTMTVRENVQVALVSHAGACRTYGPRRRSSIGPRQTGCSISSAWRRMPIARAASLPMATSSVWSLRSRSPTSRGCC